MRCVSARRCCCPNVCPVSVPDARCRPALPMGVSCSLTLPLRLTFSTGALLICATLLSLVRVWSGRERLREGTRALSLRACTCEYVSTAYLQPTAESRPCGYIEVRARQPAYACTSRHKSTR
eukprot:scaffold3163_cov139-Isochrysis_galbana.AAC.2